MLRLWRTPAYLLALIAGLLAFLTFFFLPYFEYTVGTPTTGPWTGQQLASLLNDYQLLWLEPVVAAIIVAISGWQVVAARTALQRQNDRIWGIVLLAPSLIMVLLLLLQFFIDTQNSYISTTHDFATSHASSIRSGYWIYVACMSGIVLGSMLVLASTYKAPRTQTASTLD